MNVSLHWWTSDHRVPWKYHFSIAFSWAALVCAWATVNMWWILYIILQLCWSCRLPPSISRIEKKKTATYNMSFDRFDESTSSSSWNIWWIRMSSPLLSLAVLRLLVRRHWSSKNHTGATSKCPNHPLLRLRGRTQACPALPSSLASSSSLGTRLREEQIGKASQKMVR